MAKSQHAAASRSACWRQYWGQVVPRLELSPPRRAWPMSTGNSTAVCWL
jgi:hypothetical protein